MRSFLYAAINIIFSIIEILILLRILFIFFGASALNPIVYYVYRYSAIFIQPFNGIFPQYSSLQRFTLDVNALVAFIVYAIIGYVLLNIFSSKS